ncbi:MAG: TauD/TfdA family dioxygenase [Pseudomonadota bacterium]
MPESLPTETQDIPCAWSREALSDDTSWIYQLDDTEIRVIDEAVRTLTGLDIRHQDVTAEDADLGDFRQKIDLIVDQIENGRGLALLRGVPVEGKSIEELELMYAAISSHLGRSIVQDTKGTLIDRVENRGASYADISVRGYTTNAKLTPHCDSGDIVSLLCVRPAREGGVNTISSSIAIYNEILRQHPEMLEPLEMGFHYNIRGNGPPGEFVDITAHRVPVYSYHAGRLSCRFNEKAILTSEQLPGVPPLTAMEKAAVHKVAELSVRPDLGFDILLDSGDLLLLCNHSVFHTRDSFEDWEDPAKGRLLLRKWINICDGRELTFEFADHYNTGPREGPFVNSV